jgi:hypothetical protein
MQHNCCLIGAQGTLGSQEGGTLRWKKAISKAVLAQVGEEKDFVRQKE